MLLSAVCINMHEYAILVHMNAMEPKAKVQRQASLRKLLAENRILSQDDVLSRMDALGFHVTQSSISRDFKELGVAKIDGRYMVPPANMGFSLGRFVVGLQAAGDNLCVVKTQSGWSVAVADALDHEEIPGVVGTVAGENTILIATTGAEVRPRLQEFLNIL